MKPKHNDDTSKQDDDTSSYIPIIKEYEDFIGEAIVSGVPMWVLRYYDGMPETYTDNEPKDNKH